MTDPGVVIPVPDHSRDNARAGFLVEHHRSRQQVSDDGGAGRALVRDEPVVELEGDRPRAGHTERLAICCFATAGATLMVPALARLRQKHPGVRVDLGMTDPEDPLGEATRAVPTLAVAIRSQDRPHAGVHTSKFENER
ncbi:LysR substrate-binding domain-containing protein [Streptosporangium sp. NPDC049644]|uniref:LysR substrate-binding domain-containing protein n=1 Tax=Streptosporangium sp. NPDC049644 TaxID=3155507 RepID=UPI00344A824A